MKKYISMELNGQRNLRLDLNAMSEFEDLTGKSLFQLGADLYHAKYIRALLFVALKCGKNEMTLEEIGENIGFHNMNEISKKMQELMGLSYGENENEVDSEKK